MTSKEFLKWDPPPVAHCQVGGHPIYGNLVSSDDPDYEIVNGEPMCLEHFEQGVPDVETVGRGTTKGGCHGID
jgi:hypothetical protein